MILYCIFVLFLTSSALCDGDALLDPCWSYDMDCLSRSTEKFLEKTAGGIPKTDFKPIDPLIVHSADIDLDEHMGLVFHFRHLNVTGLKKQIISDFRMDKTAKSVVLKTKADLHLTGIISIELKKDTKSFTGFTTIDATVFGTASYNYKLVPDDKGVEFFEVGPETISCEILEEPNFNLEANLRGWIASDSDAQKWKDEYLANRSVFRKKAMCHITNLIYADVVHNIRTAAKLLPKTAFFKDV